MHSNVSKMIVKGLEHAAHRTYIASQNLTHMHQPGYIAKEVVPLTFSQAIGSPSRFFVTHERHLLPAKMSKVFLERRKRPSAIQDTSVALQDQLSTLNRAGLDQQMFIQMMRSLGQQIDSALSLKD